MERISPREVPVSLWRSRGITCTVEYRPATKNKPVVYRKEAETGVHVLSKPDSEGQMCQASAICGIIRNRLEMGRWPLGGKGGQDWVTGGTARGRNTLNTYMNSYSETIALHNELYAKLHSYRWPHCGQQAQTSVASPRVSRALSKAHGFPPVWSSVPLFLCGPHATLRQPAFPGPFTLHACHFRSRNQTKLFPSPTWPCQCSHALSAYPRKWPQQVS